jgi:hypothetical protein
MPRPPSKRSTSATSAPAPTSRPSSSTRACPPPTSAPKALRRLPLGLRQLRLVHPERRPHFVYLQEMARVFGLEALRMADADVLPYDYMPTPATSPRTLKRPNGRPGSQRLLLPQGVGEGLASTLLPPRPPPPASPPRPSGAQPTGRALRRPGQTQSRPAPNRNRSPLRAGLPNRPWYRHTIYAPGEFTGYAAVVIPGVNEAIDAKMRRGQHSS